MTSYSTESAPGQYQFSVPLVDLAPNSGVVLGHIDLGLDEAVRVDCLSLYFAGWTELGSVITASAEEGAVRLGIYTNPAGEPLVNVSLTVPGDARIAPIAVLRGPATYYVILNSAATAASLTASAFAVLTSIANV